MFYLTTHSTHSNMVIWHQIYMVKDRSDSERENLLPPLHGLLFLVGNGKLYLRVHIYIQVSGHACSLAQPLAWPVTLSGAGFLINSKGSFICPIPDRTAHTTAFVTPVVEHWMEREIAQWVHSIEDRSDYPSHHEQTLLLWSYISLQHKGGGVPAAGG